MSLERQVKQHLLARPLAARFSPGPGCGGALEQELRSLLAALKTPGESHAKGVKRLRDGIVVEHLRYRPLLELVLRVTTAQDVFLLIAQGAVHNRDGLVELLRSVRWSFYLRVGDEAFLRIESDASALYHKGLIRETVSRALDEQGITVVRPKGASVPMSGGHRLSVRLVHDYCRIEISLAGAPLWQRGYRGGFHAPAPLREDFAQAAIQLSRSDAPPASLLVPFAGTGTLFFEYLIARYRIPPFVFGRAYAFESFPASEPPSVEWVRRALLEELSSRLAGEETLTARLIDRDAEALAAASANWQRFTSLLAGAGQREEGGHPRIPIEIELASADAFARPWRRWLPSGTRRVFLPLNPPYGIRLATESTGALYRRIGRACSELAAALESGGLSGFVLCPSESSWRAFLGAAPGLTAATSHFSQGGLDIRLCRFHS